MNRRLKQTGNRMLRASRQLLHLPQLAPVPHAFAALLTDPAELLERACHAALPAPQVAPDVFAETMPSVEFDSPNIARRASSRRVNLTAQGFKTSFAAVENATARSSNFADAGESVSVPTLPRISLPTLPNAPFQNVTARRRIDNPPFRQNIGDDSHIAPTGTASAPLHQENSSHGQTPPIAAKLPQPASGWLGKQAMSATTEWPSSANDSTDEPATKATPEPSRSKDEPSQSKTGTRLTRSSSRLAALLDANVRAQTEPPPASFDSRPNLPSRERQSLSLIRGATSHGPIAEAAKEERAFPELIQLPKPLTDRRTSQSIADGEIVSPSAMEPEAAMPAASLPTVEEILEELYERLRVEFLRAYGSSGG